MTELLTAYWSLLTDSCPRSVAEARDSATVVGQVRLLAGTLTLEPDGEAAGCNPAEVGSIPTGVSLGEPGALATGGNVPSAGDISSGRKRSRFAYSNPCCFRWYGPS